jgi:hypothetical protein
VQVIEYLPKISSADLDKVGNDEAAVDSSTAPKSVRPPPPKIPPDMWTKYRSVGRDATEKTSLNTTIPPNPAGFMPPKITPEVLAKYRSLASSESGPTSDDPKNESTAISATPISRRPPPPKPTPEMLATYRRVLINDSPMVSEKFPAAAPSKAPEIFTGLTKLRGHYPSGHEEQIKPVIYFDIFYFRRK